MARGIPAPDAREIEELRSEVRDLYREDDDQIRATRAVRELKNKVTMPEGATFVDLEVRVADVADEIAQVSATLGLKPPKHHIDVGPNAPDSAQENATKREKWRAGVLDVCGRGDDGPSTTWRMTDSCVGDGG